MGHRHQHSDFRTDDSAWLNTLIDTFERTEDLSDVPCDAKTVSAAMARLNNGTEKPSQRRRQATLEVHH
jgi:hypothetical protein